MSDENQQEDAGENNFTVADYRREQADRRQNNSRYDPVPEADNEAHQPNTSNTSSFRAPPLRSGPKNARDENFFQALHVNICPEFSWWSVTFSLIIIQIVVFIVELSIGGLSSTSFLAANPQTLEDMGQKDPYKMRYSGELQRFVFPIFLHGDLTHLVMNVLSQMIFGSLIEPNIGALKFIALYFLSGIGGITFSAVFSDSLSMGASTAIFGLIASYVAFLILNYNTLSQRQELFCGYLLFTIFAPFILTIMIPKADILGHLGGFLTGAIVGLWVMPCRETNPIQKERAQKTAFWAKIATVIWFILLLLPFFTLRDPTKQTPGAEIDPKKALSKAIKPLNALSPSSTDAAQQDSDTGDIFVQTELTDEDGKELNDWLAQTYSGDSLGTGWW